MPKIIFIFVLLVFIVILFAGCSFVKKLMYKPDLSKIKHIYDSDGGILILRGANVSNFAKHSEPGPKAGHSWHTLNEYKLLKEWGFNVVRYLVFWEAIEPEYGQYDDEYINEVRNRIKGLQGLGIHVIVDFHQDLYAQKFSGNGFPEWAIQDGGKPFELQEPWAKNYLQPAVKEAYTNFWESEDLQDRYVLALKHVMEKFKGIDNILGYDIMNEPIPHKRVVGFERKYLSRFYGKIRGMMMHLEWNKKMFFEPVIYTSAGLPTYLKIEPPKTWSVFAPHFYEVLLKKKKEYSNRSKKITKRSLDIKAKEAQNFGVPLFIGEWGLSPTIKDYEKFIEDFADLADKLQIGWTWWSFDKREHSGYGLLNADGTAADNVQYLSRIFPHRIAGRKPIFGYNPDKSAFMLTYVFEEGVKGETEIFVPGNIKYTVETEGEYRVEGNKIYYTNVEDDAQIITIKIEK